MIADIPLLHGAVRRCEYCHRPDVGADKCPHAIDVRYPCPKRHIPRHLQDALRRA